MQSTIPTGRGRFNATRFLPAIVSAALIAALIAAGMFLAAPAKADEPETAPSVPIRITAIGDSITSWNPPYAGNKAQSWTTTATSDMMPLVGGWARPGAPIALMEQNLTYTPSDVFVMMAGTNDLQVNANVKVTKKVIVKVKKTIKVKRHGHWVKKKVTRKVTKKVTSTVVKTVKPATPVAARFAALDRMAEKMHATHTVVLAVPPFGYGYSLGAQWNAQLKAYAADRGFTFVDPWVDLRDGNAWKPGADRGDRVHPSPESAAVAGAVIRDAVAELVSGSPVQ